MPAIKVTIENMQTGSRSETGVMSVELGAGNDAVQAAVIRPMHFVGNCTAAQMAGLQRYLGHIKIGTDTSAIETALESL